MAAATYTTDLVDITLAENLTNWTALGGGASGLVAETDFFIQGAACVSKAGWSAATKGQIYNATAGVTVPTGSAVFMWLYMWAPNALSVQSSGGLQALIGSATTAFKQWYVRGSDTYQYGGWICVPIDPTVAASATTGAPSSTLQYFGAQANITGAVSKGQPLGVDAIRYGKQLKVLNGDTANGYGTFAGAAAQNDLGANRWGLLQSIDGGYLQQGQFLLGQTGTTAVDFRDANRSIVIANTQYVGSGFNVFEIQHVSSRVDWTSCVFSALNSTARGNVLVTDNATFNVTGCAFTDMGTFTFKGLTTVDGCTFRRCNTITQNGAIITNSEVDSSVDNVRGVLSNNPGNISYTNFESDGTGHAIEITTAGTYSFSGNTFVGYAAVNGTTGNEAIYNNSGGAVTLNITNGGGTPTIRNGAGATTTVNNAVALTVTIVDASNNPIVGNGTSTGARVAVYKKSDNSVIIEPTFTDAAGKVTGSFNYATDTVIYVRARLDSSGGTRYLPIDTSGTITNTGYSVTITMLQDPFSA